MLTAVLADLTLPAECSATEDRLTMKLTKGLDAFLFALGPDLESELATALVPHCREVRTVQSIPADAGVVFCCSNIDVVTRLRAAEPTRIIVVVSRHPEVSDWLDALECGATDYCAAPFESTQLLWLLQSSQRPGQLAA
jgi:CheY-like chemotaxis protein